MRALQIAFVLIAALRGDAMAQVTAVPSDVTPSGPSLAYFWASPTEFDAEQPNTRVQACVTMDSGEASVSALIAVGTETRMISMTGERFEGARSVCGDLRIPRDAPRGSMRVSVKVRNADSTAQEIDPCALGFACELQNVERARPFSVDRGPWPSDVPQVAAGLASCGDSVTSTSEPRHVERVIDGDTLVLDGGERVRLIGVDTPETVHPNLPVQPGGKSASAYTRQTVSGGIVYLAYDSRQGRTDRYGRTLAYVTLPDGRVLNEELVAAGHGIVDPRFPFCEMDAYRKQQAAAHAVSRGVWSDISRAERVAQRSYNANEPFTVQGGGSASAGGGTSGGAGGPVSVRAYTRKDGTQVKAHTRSRPNSSD
jgi:micrococcal nuclease